MGKTYTKPKNIYGKNTKSALVPHRDAIPPMPPASIVCHALGPLVTVAVGTSGIKYPPPSIHPTPTQTSNAQAYIPPMSEQGARRSTKVLPNRYEQYVVPPEDGSNQMRAQLKAATQNRTNQRRVLQLVHARAGTKSDPVSRAPTLACCKMSRDSPHKLVIFQHQPIGDISNSQTGNTALQNLQTRIDEPLTHKEGTCRPTPHNKSESRVRCHTHKYRSKGCSLYRIAPHDHCSRALR
jgi:hypothetical protein